MQRDPEFSGVFCFVGMLIFFELQLAGNAMISIFLLPFYNQVILRIV